MWRLFLVLDGTQFSKYLAESLLEVASVTGLRQEMALGDDTFCRRRLNAKVKINVRN